MSSPYGNLTSSRRCDRCGITIRDWDDDKHKTGALTITLELAVPLWIAELAAMDETDRERHIWWWTQTAADRIAGCGDRLQYGDPKRRKSERAEVATDFNYLASGLAALAWQPGGVTFAGRHWCVPVSQRRPGY